MPVVVVVMSFKGGVGKSTVLASLAAALGRRQRRVLVIDMDPQSNVSRRLGHPDDPAMVVPTLSDALRVNAPGCAVDIRVPARWDDPAAAYVDLLPARFDLEARVAESRDDRALSRLVNVTSGMLSPYDWILVDCPPSLGHLTQMSMVLAGQRTRPHPGWVLVVTEPEYDPMRGAQLTIDFVASAAPGLGVPNLRVKGLVVNRVRPISLHVENIENIRETFGSLVWSPMIPLWSALADAMGSAVPVHMLPGKQAAHLAGLFATLADRMEITQ